MEPPLAAASEVAPADSEMPLPAPAADDPDETAIEPAEPADAPVFNDRLPEAPACAAPEPTTTSPVLPPLALLTLTAPLTPEALLPLPTDTWPPISSPNPPTTDMLPPVVAPEPEADDEPLWMSTSPPADEPEDASTATAPPVAPAPPATLTAPPVASEAPALRPRAAPWTPSLRPADTVTPPALQCGGVGVTSHMDGWRWQKAGASGAA